MTKMKKKIIKKIGRTIFPKRKPPKPVHFSEEVKRAVLRYQRYECANFKCHNKRFLEFDHIRGNQNNSLENCQVLCPTCHRRKTRIDITKKAIAKRIRLAKTKKR